MLLKCKGDELIINITAICFIRKAPVPVAELYLQIAGRALPLRVTGEKAIHIEENVFPIFCRLTDLLYINPQMITHIEKTFAARFVPYFSDIALELNDIESRVFHDRVVNPPRIVQPGLIGA